MIFGSLDFLKWFCVIYKLCLLQILWKIWNSNSAVMDSSGILTLSSFHVKNACLLPENNRSGACFSPSIAMVKTNRKKLFHCSAISYPHQSFHFLPNILTGFLWLTYLPRMSWWLFLYISICSSNFHFVLLLSFMFCLPGFLLLLLLSHSLRGPTVS